MRSLDVGPVGFKEAVNASLAASPASDVAEHAVIIREVVRGYDVHSNPPVCLAGFEHDFYLATKHYGVHYMKVRLGLSNADIAPPADWSEASVEAMVRTYAHTNVGALDRIRAAYAMPPGAITNALAEAPAPSSAFESGLNHCGP